MTTEQVTKKKKSIFKRWWFWVVLVILIGAVASGGSGDDTDKITDEGKSTETAKADKGITSEATAKPKEEAPQAEPTKVWEGNGVTIYFKEATDEGLKFLVENTNNKSVTIQADSVALNGFSSNNIMMSDDISPNSKGYATAMTSDLVDAGTPEKVSGNLTVIDSNTFDTIANAQFTDVPVNK